MKKAMAAVCVLLLLVCAGPALGQVDLIANGSFESGFDQWNVQTWERSNGSLQVTTSTVGFESGQGLPGAYDGTHYAATDQNGPSAHALTQFFSVGEAPGSAALAFAMAINNRGAATVVGSDFDPIGSGPNQYVSVDLFKGMADGFSPTTPLWNFFTGSTLNSSFMVSNPWVLYTFDVTSLLSEPGYYTLRFAEVDNAGWQSISIDQVSLVASSTVTPEPLSIALLGTGLAGIAMARRRRKPRS